MSVMESALRNEMRRVAIDRSSTHSWLDHIKQPLHNDVAAWSVLVLHSPKDLADGLLENSVESLELSEKSISAKRSGRKNESAFKNPSSNETIATHLLTSSSTLISRLTDSQTLASPSWTSSLLLLRHNSARSLQTRSSSGDARDSGVTE